MLTVSVIKQKAHDKFSLPGKRLRRLSSNVYIMQHLHSPDQAGQQIQETNRTTYYEHSNAVSKPSRRDAIHALFEEDKG